MEKQTPYLTDNMEGFAQERIDYSKYETSFRRWLVQEIESGRMNKSEARTRFQLPNHFDVLYRDWQKKYSEEIVVSLPLMSAKERSDNKELEKRIKQLEKELELAQMKTVALNTMIDIAEKDYKLEIRKKFGPKQ
jgi:hypothetical protein